MKTYLDLIPISEKIHKKKDRMTKICIFLAVFLVSVIFGMADMEIRSQKMQTIKMDGNWHMILKNVSSKDAALIGARPDVESLSWYNAMNYRLRDHYMIGGKQSVICGGEKPLFSDIMGMEIEGQFPSSEDEVILSENAKNHLKVKKGDQITLEVPSGADHTYKISGFVKNTSMLMEKDVLGVFLTKDAFLSLYEREKEKTKDYDSVYYIRLKESLHMKGTISDIKKQFHLGKKDVVMNHKLLGVLGQSDDSYILRMYGTALILFLLVLLASILMITGSLNSNVAKKTEFFGLLRCLGASKKQVKRFVRTEALRWCKSAIPAGLIAGMAVVWILCAVLREVSPTLFGEMPVFSISWISLVFGAGMGILSVLLAAGAPAKKAAKVSPLTAVSGNAMTVSFGKKGANTRFFKIDTALGIQHAKGSKKNFVLMTGSFALSIILFLAFSAGIAFMNHAIRPLKPYSPDLSIISQEETCSVEKSLQRKLEQNPAVKKVYGRSFAYDVPVRIKGRQKSAMVISYEKHQFKWAKADLLEGSIDPVIEGKAVLAEYRKEAPVHAGDCVIIEYKGQKKKVTVAGVVSTSPFQGEKEVMNVFCSETLFTTLTGQENYTILDIQLSSRAGDREVKEIRKMAGDHVNFSDQRMKNKETIGTYFSFALFVYGFLVAVALITVFHIMNTIAMSVSARMKQFGTMRAIGMSDRQLRKMILAEALTYAFSGCIVGCAVGLFIHRKLFESLITFRWGDVWQIPFGVLSIILVLVICASVAAVVGPVRQIREMTIVDTISEK